MVEQIGWSGLPKATGVVSKSIGSRSTETLAGSAQGLLHSFLKVDSECQSTQEMVGCDRSWRIVVLL